MFTTLLTSTLFLALAISGAQAEFAINTPKLVQCQDATLTWAASSGPYNIIVVPENNPCTETLADLGDHTGTTYKWKVNVSAGNTVLLSIEDSKGEEAWSGAITVESSDDASCLPGNTNSSSSGVPSSPAPSTPATTLVADGPGPSSSATPSESAIVVGAAANGDNPLGNGSPSVRQFSGAAFAVTALAAVAALAL